MIANVAVPNPVLAAASLTPIFVFGVLAWSSVITLVSSNWIRNKLCPTATSSILTTSSLISGFQLKTIALLLLAPVVPVICLPGTNSKLSEPDSNSRVW